MRAPRRTDKVTHTHVYRSTHYSLSMKGRHIEIHPMTLKQHGPNWDSAGVWLEEAAGASPHFQPSMSRASRGESHAN